MPSRHYTSRRSPLSREAAPSQVERNLRGLPCPAPAGLDPVTEDPRAPYLVGQRIADAPATPVGNPFRELQPLVRAIVGTAPFQAYPLLTEDGVAPATITWHVRVTGPDVRPAGVKVQGATPQQLAEALRPAWRAARRAKDTDRLAEELGQLRGEALTQEEAAELHEKLGLTACRTPADFRAAAAHYRTLAAAAGRQAA